MDTPAHSVLQDLLTRLGLPPEAAQHNIRLLGRDPVVPSRYRVGLASATALAAQAVGIIEIWKQRGGARPGCNDRLAARRSAGSAHPSPTQGRGGRVLQIPWPASERQVYFPTRDGRLIYLMRHAVYYEHLSKLLAFLDCSPDSASIARATAKWDALALEDALADRKLMGTIVRSFEEWNDSPQGRHLAPRIPVEVERIGDSAPIPFTLGARPLSGIRIVDMAHVLAGPVTSRVLAEQGAEVIHVSAPHQPDPVHVMIDTGFGKRNAYVDLNRKEDVASVHRLIEDGRRFRPLVAAGVARSARPLTRGTGAAAPGSDLRVGELLRL